MTLQALVIIGTLVVVVLALAAVAGALLSPKRRAARRARALEEADRSRNDPNGQVNPAVYRWQAKGADTARNPPGAGMPLM